MNHPARRLIIEQLFVRANKRGRRRADGYHETARRQLRSVLLSSTTPMSWPEIAAEVGYASHSTAVQASAHVERRCTDDPLLHEAIEALAEAVREIARLHGLPASSKHSATATPSPTHPDRSRPVLASARTQRNQVRETPALSTRRTQSAKSAGESGGKT